MSLMVGPISNVSFRAQEPVQQNIEDILSRPGAFAKPDVLTDKPVKKKHTFLNFVAGVLVTVGIIAGGVYCLKRGMDLKTIENLEGYKGMKLAKARLTNIIVKGSDYVEKGAVQLIDLATQGWDKLKGLFKSTPAA